MISRNKHVWGFIVKVAEVNILAKGVVMIISRKFIVHKVNRVMF